MTRCSWCWWCWQCWMCCSNVGVRVKSVRIHQEPQREQLVWFRIIERTEFHVRAARIHSHTSQHTHIWSARTRVHTRTHFGSPTFTFCPHTIQSVDAAQRFYGATNQTCMDITTPCDWIQYVQETLTHARWDWKPTYTHRHERTTSSLVKVVGGRRRRFRFVLPILCLRCDFAWTP